MVDNTGRNKRKLKCKRHKRGMFGLDMSSREASVFEASKKGLAEAGCVDMVSADLHALEIGAVLLLERNHEMQCGVEPCAAVIVFGHVLMKVCKPATCCMSCLDLDGRKVKGKLRENGRDVRSLGGGVRDQRHEPRCVLLLLLQRYPSGCAPRGMWNETGAGVKRCLRIACRDCSAQGWDDWEERQFRFADQVHDEHDCKFRVLEVSEVRTRVSHAGRVQERSLVVGGKSGSRDVGFSIPKAGQWKNDQRSQEDERRRIEKSCNVK